MLGKGEQLWLDSCRLNRKLEVAVDSTKSMERDGYLEKYEKAKAKARGKNTIINSYNLWQQQRCWCRSGCLHQHPLQGDITPP